MHALRTAGLSDNDFQQLTFSTRASFGSMTIASHDYKRSKQRHNHAVKFFHPDLAAPTFGLVQCFVHPLPLSRSSGAALVSLLDTQSTIPINMENDSTIPHIIRRHLRDMVEQQLWLEVSEAHDSCVTVPLDNITEKCVLLDLGQRKVISFLPNHVEID